MNKTIYVVTDPFFDTDYDEKPALVVVASPEEAHTAGDHDEDGAVEVGVYELVRKIKVRKEFTEEEM